MTDTEKEIEKLKSSLADAVRSFTRMETLYKLKCNELESANNEIAGLTGKIKAFEQDNENLRRTIEEGCEEVHEKTKMRENELHEPKIDMDIKAAEGYSTLYYVSANCPVCDFFLGKSMGLSKEQAINEVKESIYNYCPHCGARLKEVKNETPKN